MTEAQINETINNRVKEMLKDEKILALYNAKESEAVAKDWIISQALITLMYSPEERAELLKKQAADKLELRKTINATLYKLIKSKSTKNKVKLRAQILGLEAEFKARFGYGITYNWEK